jgi:hypothetical protein
MTYLDNVQAKRDVENTLRTQERKMTLNRVKIDAEEANILLMSDEHLGSQEYKQELHEQVLEHAFDAGWYILHLGDGIEAATRNSVGAGVYSQEEIIDRQISDWTALYQPFVDSGKFLGAHPGNHEMRVMNDNGIDVMRQMCRQMGAKYFGVGRAHHLRVGNQTYTMYTTHGASGATKPHTKIKGCLDLEKVIDTDIYAMGHLHQLSHHVRNYYDINKSKRAVEKRAKHFILTGSYLDYPGSYAQVKCMEPARMGSPRLQLNGLENQIKVVMQ